jgi:hypothetical protein
MDILQTNLTSKENGMKEITNSEQRFIHLKSVASSSPGSVQDEKDVDPRIKQFELTFKETGNRLYRMETKQNQIMKAFASKSDISKLYKKVFFLLIVSTLLNPIVLYYVQKYF